MSEAVRCPTLKGPRWKVFASTGRWSAFHRCLPGEDTLEPMTFLFYLKSFKDPPPEIRGERNSDFAKIFGHL